MTKELKDLFELQDKVTLKDLAKTGLSGDFHSQNLEEV